MEFIKVLWDNLVKGPVTEPFPLGEAPTPARFRGKVKVDPDLCVGCGICRHVCTAGAINITARPDNSGYDIVVWHNSCCLCGQCRHYCPTKAITLSNDWHNVHRNDKKFTWVEHQFVPYETCEQCGALQRFLPPSVNERIYAGMSELENLPRFERLCVKCRMVMVAVAEERACRLPDPVIEPADTSVSKPEVKPEVKPEAKPEARPESRKDPVAKAVKASADKAVKTTEPEAAQTPAAAPEKAAGTEPASAAVSGSAPALESGPKPEPAPTPDADKGIPHA